MSLKIDYDVIIAGCGISGLLLAWNLSRKFRVLIIEDQKQLPRNKYWLTDDQSLKENESLSNCVDSIYETMDFISYDDFTARVNGPYILWNTNKLLGHLVNNNLAQGVEILYRHRFYSYQNHKKYISVKCENKNITCKLLVDCMGYKSPLMKAKSVIDILGYYLMVGATYKTKKEVAPIALHNVTINDKPSYFELFPTSEGRAHAALILPARSYDSRRQLAEEFSYLATRSNYATILDAESRAEKEPLYGIIPVGHLRKVALDRIFFFGEAGQFNPATSATGLTRMLRTHRAVGSFLMQRLENNELCEKSLSHKSILAMSNANRYFHQALFERILNLNSDGFKEFVMEIDSMDGEDVNNFIFADYDFSDVNGVLKTIFHSSKNVRMSAINSIKYMFKL
ncbi:NAD(P)/FAD-dependent oxidoreductase [Maridesulfovibrio salexigens]|uniref:Lycopene beta and epsilon cyclase n=1 Tax=Maridesulfovibrio salexigens (strain ATCC 14822 / DSM 2638 / NCIMB 8403 / VKM B-1763) TaxID=526222 RepID=C6C216_MARSD|nr:lycopene cyclase family protein [Maridesulfovibrio salexigens]ACS81217.1 Lycopene beta and epsilon cyclase [Maridesulfovibrio salexigens DSM 2638]